MGFRCGIVGLPNVGKSTLFNALTHAGVAAENFPFCTVEPNSGIVPLADERLDRVAALVNPARVVPATIEFVDIAGLVSGASRGEGLGNQFLAHIREVDAIAHVVRCFRDDNVAHVGKGIDPVGDIEVIETELLLADLGTVERAIERVEKVAKSGDKEAIARRELLQSIAGQLDEGTPARNMVLTDLGREMVRDLFLVTMKPVMYVANVDEEGIGGSSLASAVEEIAQRDSAPVVVICSKLEAELAEIDEEERAEFLADYGIGVPGIEQMARAGFELLNLHTFFTTNEKEVRAWTFPEGIHAAQAAGLIHTDFEKGFIRAEVIACEDFVTCGGEHGARETGKLRLEGRDYAVRDGDVIKVRFNV